MSEPTEGRTRLAVIYGSTREGRLCGTVVAWAASSARAWGGFDVDVVDPLELGLPARHEKEDGPAVRRLQQRLGEADAFLVVTPEYNHSYPAALKFLIDSVHEPWQAKPVAFVSYGGMSGGLRAVEHLRQVFAELHAVGIRDGVSFANVWDLIDDASDTLQAGDRTQRSMTRALSRLRWWADALRRARHARPYHQAV